MSHDFSQSSRAVLLSESFQVSAWKYCPSEFFFDSTTSCLLSLHESVHQPIILWHGERDLKRGLSEILKAVSGTWARGNTSGFSLLGLLAHTSLSYNKGSQNVIWLEPVPFA
jgi:hypothetical protein